MRIALLTLLLSLSASGCVILQPQPLKAQPQTKSKKCPPGHVWSDGKCHDTGKGNDKDHKDEHKDEHKDGKDNDHKDEHKDDDKDKHGKDIR